jgi:hypothetical protein
MVVKAALNCAEKAGGAGLAQIQLPHAPGAQLHGGDD